MHRLNARFAAPWLAAAILPMIALAGDSDSNHQADNPAYSWDLGELYPSPQAWAMEHDRILVQADALDKYRDTVGRSAGDMLAALRSAMRRRNRRASAPTPR
jgi:hypothetical protein